MRLLIFANKVSALLNSRLKKPALEKVNWYRPVYRRGQDSICKNNQDSSRIDYKVSRGVILQIKTSIKTFILLWEFGA